MPDYYNSMQASAGLMPQSNQLIFPGQFAAAIAAQSSAQFTPGGMFPSQTFTPGAGMSPLFQGPTGFLTPMNAGAPFNPYASPNPPNPFANLVAYGSTQGRPSPFSAYAPNPPPAYAGLQGTGALPFAPPPMASPFDTPYGSTVAQSQATNMRGWAASQAGMGSAFRVAPTLGFAAIGGMLGGPIGAAGGALLGEASGLGNTLQNAYANYVTTPRLAIQGAAQGFEHLSQRFAVSGPNLNPSGSGFSHHASLEAAQGLSDLSNSASFRRETQNRFNQQDVFKITQGSIENGLMSGASTPQNVTARVREIAKSLSAFMELAKEPDIQRAIQTMGSLRNSGPNLQETMSAVASGRTFARMAGSTFQGLSEIGGVIGSQTYQGMGLTQGLGFQSGMGAYGQASASINQGILNPQVASLVGGREGLAGLNAAFSGAQLQLPMTAMGLMGRGGGLSAGAVQNYLTGGANPFSLTSQGTGALSSLAGRMGVGGMGMAIGMQSLMQDSVGRILESQGPFARRNVEDRSIMNLMRQMGMNGSEGFMTAAQMLGMQGTAAMARTQELQSGAYWETQQDQLRTNQREARALSDRRRSENRPTWWNTLRNSGVLGVGLGRAGAGLHHLGVEASQWLGGSETHDYDASPTTDSGRRRLDAMVRSDEFGSYMRGLGGARRGGLPDVVAGMRYGTQLAWAEGYRGVTASFYGLFQGSQGYRTRAARDYQAGGEYATNLLSSSETEQRRAMGRLNETFGGIEGLAQFTQGSSTLAREANSAFRVGRSNLFGDRGSQAIRGSSVQTVFRDTLRRQGVSDSEIDRRWSTEQSTIRAQHAFGRALYGETAAEEEAWRTTAEAGSRFRQDGSSRERITSDAEGAYRTLMGNVGREGQEAFRTISDDVEGLGPEGSNRHKASRRLMTGLVMAQVAGTGSGDIDLRNRANARISAMYQQGRDSGLTEEDITLIAQRARGISQRHRASDGALAAGRGFIDSGADLNTIGATEESVLRETGSRQVTAGYGRLARSGGELENLFKGLDGTGESEEQLRERIMGMSPEARRRLGLERGHRGIATAIEQIRQGDSRGMVALRVRASREGRDAVQLEHEYDREQGTGVGAWFRRQVGSYDDARTRWVDDQLRTTSPEERAARAQSGESQDARGDASRAGIGRAGDALLEASRELNEVTRNLREVSQGNNISGLVGRPM